MFWFSCEVSQQNQNHHTILAEFTVVCLSLSWKAKCVSHCDVNHVLLFRRKTFDGSLSALVSFARRIRCGWAHWYKHFIYLYFTPSKTAQNEPWHGPTFMSKPYLRQGAHSKQSRTQTESAFFYLESQHLSHCVLGQNGPGLAVVGSGDVNQESGYVRCRRVHPSCCFLRIRVPFACKG